MIDHGSDFHAVNGHVAKLPQNGRGIVCGDKKIFKLLDVDGNKLPPNKAFRTVRQRLGLDISTLLYESQKSPLSFSTNGISKAVVTVGSEIDKYYELIDLAVNDLVLELEISIIYQK